MNVTYKQLLETSYIQVNSRIDELKRFFDITRTYSIKTNSHIKIITSIVNELTDSDDILHLVDTELTGVHYNSKYTHTTNTNKILGRSTNELPNSQALPLNHTINVNLNDKKSVGQPEEYRSINLPDRGHTNSTENTRFQPNIEVNQTNAKGGDENALAKMLESYKNENQKLWDSLKRGQSDTDFIKGIFEKLLDSYTKQRTETPVLPQLMERDSIHQCTSTNCIKNHNHKMGLPPQHASQSCYVPQNVLSKKGKGGHGMESEGYDDAESLQSLKDGLGRNDFDGIDNSRMKKGGNENAINGMFKQIIQLKSQLERVTEEKNRQINDLTRLLDETRTQSAILRNEIESLSNQKNLLENSTKDILNQTKLISDRNNINFNNKFKDMEREVLQLQSQIENLSNENDDLKRKLKDSQKQRNEDEFYRIKYNNLESDYEEMKRKFNDLEGKNGELIGLLDRTQEKKSKVKMTSESMTVDYNDDLLKCLYSQADYIESTMNTVLSGSHYKS